VLLDVSYYEEMVDTIETLQEVNQGRIELDERKGIAHDQVMKTIRKRLNW